MISFYRKIRRKFLAQNRIGKYLAYALGEIILVVIGILIALEVNNWNINRLNHIEEQKLLRQLKIEFSKNKDQLKQKIELRDRALRSAKYLLDLIDRKTIQTNGNQIDSLLSYTIPVYTFDPLYGIMSQLIEAGKLSLIENDSLREALANWNGVIADFKETEDVYSTFNVNDFRPFLYRNTNYRNIINERIRNGVITKTLIDEELDSTSEIGNSSQPANMQILLRSREFENYMASMISQLSYLNTQSNGVEDYIDSILEMIHREQQH